MTEFSRVLFQKHHLRTNRAIREAAAHPPAPPKKKLATLTPAEDKAWVAAFAYALTELHYDPRRADRYAWRDVRKQFPRLAAFDGCLA